MKRYSPVCGLQSLPICHIVKKRLLIVIDIRTGGILERKQRIHT